MHFGPGNARPGIPIFARARAVAAGRTDVPLAIEALGPGKAAEAAAEYANEGRLLQHHQGTEGSLQGGYWHNRELSERVAFFRCSK
jgi:hypothetical protein